MRKTAPIGAVFIQFRLQFHYVLGLGTAVTFNYVELNSLSFVQGFESISLDSAKMYEYIIAAFNFNKTKTFFCIKPFYCTCLHLSNTSTNFFQIPVEEKKTIVGDL